MAKNHQLPPLSISNWRHTHSLPTAHHEKPEEVGSFSTDADRTFIHDRSALRYYVGPSGQNSAEPLFDRNIRGLDLNDYFDSSTNHEHTSGMNNILNWIIWIIWKILILLSWIIRCAFRYFVGPSGQNSADPLFDGHVELDLNDGFDASSIDEFTSELDSSSTDEHTSGLNNILHWILLNPSSLQTTDFICQRRLLRTVMFTPFFGKTGWKIAAVRFREKIYMKITVNDDTWESEEEIRKAKFTGFKFEQYVTSDSPDGAPNTTESVNNKKGFYLVFKYSLNDQRLLYSGEVDCVDKNDHRRYIELKSTKHLPEAKRFIRFKLPRDWTQAFLIGISCIVYGFKDENGIVTRLKTYQTSDIPTLCAAANDNKCFRAPLAIDFLDSFLKHVKSTVQDNSYSFYVFERRTYSEVGRDSNIITCHKEASESRYAFLPAWYTDDIGSA